MKHGWKLTREQIDNIISLCRQGNSKLSIAKKFKINHATVIYHIKHRDKLENRVVIVTTTTVTRAPELPPEREKLNKGHNYIDYIIRDKLRGKSEIVKRLMMETVSCKARQAYREAKKVDLVI
jgi:hypothetical protein